MSHGRRHDEQYYLPSKNFKNQSANNIPSVLKSPTTAGAVITMPYKQSVMPHLSSLSPGAKAIGAVNNVYITPDGVLHGSNTDWEGVRGCLLSGDTSGAGKGKPALVVGAGGACRAAIYTLYNDFAAREIYIINRDVGEVEALQKDVSKYATELKLTHIQTTAQASSLPSPFYIVGTVPDFAPSTPSEIEMRRILEICMSEERKGVLLDMCFKPRNTRTMKLGRERGWRCVCGTDVIAYQIDEQWSLWTGRDVRGKLDNEEAWRVLNEQAEKSTAINF